MKTVSLIQSFFAGAFCFSLAVPLSATEVTTPPEAEIERLDLDPFYKKYASAGGFPIVSSEQVSDFALKEAAYLINQMLDGHEDIRTALIDNKVRFVIMAPDEFTTDVPEHSHLEPKDYWDKRARGLGSTPKHPAVSCGEENILGFRGDPYKAENILIHELAHSIHQQGINTINPKFQKQLEQTYNRAVLKGLWKGKYAATNPAEYWAEGVQSWFGTNAEDNFEHNHVNTRDELQAYDPGLASLIESQLGKRDWAYQRPPERETPPAHLKGYDPDKAPTFEWPAELLAAYKAIEEGKHLKPVESLPFKQIKGMKSPPGGKKVSLRIDNRSKERGSVDWIDFEGNRKNYGFIDPGRNMTQQTFAGHVFLISGERGQPLGLFPAAEEPGLALVKQPTN